jgi:hypothetical protein
LSSVSIIYDDYLEATTRLTQGVVGLSSLGSMLLRRLISLGGMTRVLLCGLE